MSKYSKHDLAVFHLPSWLHVGTETKSRMVAIWSIVCNIVRDGRIKNRRSNWFVHRTHGLIYINDRRTSHLNSDKSGYLPQIGKAMRTEILARKAWPHHTNTLSRWSTRKMQPDGLPAEVTTAQSFYDTINQQNQQHITSHLLQCTNTVLKELNTVRSHRGFAGWSEGQRNQDSFLSLIYHIKLGN